MNRISALRQGCAAQRRVSRVPWHGYEVAGYMSDRSDQSDGSDRSDESDKAQGAALASKLRAEGALLLQDDYH